MKFIDDILNKITMYKLVVYELLGLLIIAGILGAFKLVPYSPQYIAYSVAIIFIIAWTVNKIFAYFFAAPSNPESTYITALILALIIAPPAAYGDFSYFALAGWATVWAIASKYIFAIREKHIFNPAAFGVAVTALFLNQSATWWVGTLWMLPFVAVGGFLIARKTRRLDMVVAFGAALVGTILVLGFTQGGVLHVLQESLLYAPAVFFGTVMLTEPLTTPPTRFLRIWYAIIVGFLFAPEVHIGSFYFTPELALLAGNLFAYAVSPKLRLLLSLKDRITLAPDTYEFVFSSNRKLKFEAGQYLEWTLPHEKADGRGIRRYFTIASSPTDPDIRVGVKFYKPSSTFKDKLLALKRGDTIVASQVAGDFTLPENKKKKLVFIAGGIGITPFRSMIEYMIEKKEKRDIILLYSNKTVEDVAYAELLDRAERELGIETLPIISNQTPEMLARGDFPTTIDQHLIRSQIPDYEDRIFYISGPHGMIEAFSTLLRQLGVPRIHIHKDFFPGFA
jgi:ferredoxin-NADP reductase